MSAIEHMLSVKQREDVEARLANCDIGTEPAILNEITAISGVFEAAELSGVYDIVVKVSEESMEDVAKSARKIRAIANVRSTLTMIVSEEERSVKQIEEMVA